MRSVLVVGLFFVALNAVSARAEQWNETDVFDSWAGKYQVEGGAEEEIKVLGSQILLTEEGKLEVFNCEPSTMSCTVDPSFPTVQCKSNVLMQLSDGTLILKNPCQGATYVLKRK